jgi:putative sterol carrier protein
VRFGWVIVLWIVLPGHCGLLSRLLRAGQQTSVTTQQYRSLVFLVESEKQIFGKLRDDFAGTCENRPEPPHLRPESPFQIFFSRPGFIQATREIDQMSEATTVPEAVESMKSRFNPKAAAGMNAVYLLDITGDGGGKYAFAIQDGDLTVDDSGHDSPNITVTMADHDYIKMANGKLDTTMAYMGGKLKIKGDMGLAMKLQQLFPAS